MAHRDCEEYLASSNAEGARYLLVGAQAVAFHARPRFTRHLDLLVARSKGNARRVLRAIPAFFGGAKLGYAIEDLVAPATILQLGVEPVRIDILTSIAGVDDFASAWRRRAVGAFGRVPDAPFMELDDLIAAKRASGRHRDLDDLRYLLLAKGAKERAPGGRRPRSRGRGGRAR